MCRADHVDTHVWARAKTLQGLPHESNMIIFRIAHVQVGTPRKLVFLSELKQLIFIPRMQKHPPRALDDTG
jgi:hypothetical protein